jgi:hypothetical protein
VAGTVLVRRSPAVAYPLVAGLRAAVDRGDWAMSREIVDAVEPAERTRLLRFAADRRSRRMDGFLSGIVANDPEDGAAAAMLGFHRIHRAWLVRTEAYRPSRWRFARFHQRLAQAEEVLAPATEANPDDPALWTARLTTARGLEMGLAEAGARYHRLAEIDPHHLPGQAALLQQLCPKWGGSWNLAFDFARECAAAAPSGAPNPVLVVEAHLERWCQDGARGWIASPAARDEIMAAGFRGCTTPTASSFCAGCGLRHTAGAGRRSSTGWRRSRRRRAAGRSRCC